VLGGHGYIREQGMEQYVINECRCFSAAKAGKRQLDTTILRAPLWCVVRGNRI
jgi:hypothetical protein